MSRPVARGDLGGRLPATSAAADRSPRRAGRHARPRSAPTAAMSAISSASTKGSVTLPAGSTTSPAITPSAQKALAEILREPARSARSSSRRPKRSASARRAGPPPRRGPTTGRAACTPLSTASLGEGADGIGRSRHHEVGIVGDVDGCRRRQAPAPSRMCRSSRTACRRTAMPSGRQRRAPAGARPPCCPVLPLAAENQDRPARPDFLSSSFMGLAPLAKHEVSSCLQM